MRLRAGYRYIMGGLVLVLAAGPAWGATFTATVVDADTGARLGGHVYLTLGKKGKKIGEYEGSGFWRGKRCNYASFGPDGFSLTLPDEPCRVWIERGREYVPVVETFAGGAPGTITREVRLRRFIDMNALGWWSSDLHIHRGPERTAEQMQREDVNVAFPLVWWNGPKFADELKRWAAKSTDGRTVRVDDTHVMSLYNMEYERDPHGAIFLLHLKEFVHGEVPPVEKVCLGAIEAGGFVNSAKPIWKCSVETVILGKASMMEVVNNHYLWPAALNMEAWGFERNFAAEWRRYEKEFIGYAKYNCDIYYALLNCGYRLAAVGGTADGVLGTHIGYNRTYVYTGEKQLSVDRWVEALQAGRSFATNGPMLFVKVNDQLPGSEITAKKGETVDVTVAIDVRSPDPLDAVEVIHNGSVAVRLTPRREGSAPYIFKHRHNVTASESGWFAVRAFARVTPDNVALAHTTPVWVQVGDEPVRPTRAEVSALIKRVDWWINWSKQKKPAATETYERLKRVLLKHRERGK